MMRQKWRGETETIGGRGKPGQCMLIIQCEGLPAMIKLRWTEVPSETVDPIVVSGFTGQNKYLL